ncbi:MAG: AraC family transcriptional regulator, partial [Candidatus Thorarchaeota archaeon]
IPWVGLISDKLEHDIEETISGSEADIASVLSVIANKVRMVILTSLHRKPREFSELLEISGLSKTALAHHLNRLVESGIIVHVSRGLYEISSDGTDFLRSISAAYASSKRRQDHEAARRVDYIQRAHTKRKDKMDELEVRIEKLEPMRVASIQAISKSPENEAWNKMRTWAEPRGLLDDVKKNPVFGFNNPNPSPGKEEYGYEFWIKVGDDAEPEGDIKIKEFEGGLFAVTTTPLKADPIYSEDGHHFIGAWKRLGDWIKSSKYEFGDQQCLERAHDPGASEDDLILDLYWSIKE